MTEFSLGSYVRTKKGAKFCGKIIGFHALDSDNPGCVVEAVHPLFAGTRHVYPLVQVEIYVPE